jgi:hypothetical protein
MMRGLLMSLFLVAALAPARAVPMTFDFEGQRYTVDYQAQVKQPDGTAGQGIAEFTLNGETVDNWTKLIGYHYYPEQVGTPSQAAANLGKYLKEINKDFTYALFDTRNKDDAIIEFTTWEGTGEVIEFDVFKYARPEAGPGVIALQFAQRLRLKDMSVEEFQALRERAVAAMMKAEIGPMRSYFAEQYRNPATKQQNGPATAEEQAATPSAAAR